jgi:hypothetical protein
MMPSANPNVTELSFSRLRSLYAHPQAMRIFGVENRELSHNRFLHWLLTGGMEKEIAQRVLRGLLRACASQRSRHQASFASWAEKEFGEMSCTYQAWAGGADRPDELVLIKSSDGAAAALLIELKCQADPDARQLSRYFEKASSELTNTTILPALLHLADPAMESARLDDFPVISLRSFREVLATCQPRSSSLSPLLHDYVDVLDFLLAREEVIHEHADRLGQIFLNGSLDPGDPFQHWLLEQKVWVQRRVLERVASTLDGEWSPGVHGDANGASLDFHLGGLGCYEEKRGACFFFKWRIGLGLEVHVILDPYHEAGHPTQLAVLKTLYEKGRVQIQATADPQRSNVYTGRLKRSGMVFREPNKSYSPAEIATMIRSRVLEYRPLLGQTARNVAKELRLTLR